MNSSNKLLGVIAAAMVIAGAGLFVQYRVARGSGTTHITAAEFDRLIAAMPENQRQQHQSESEKQQLASEVEQVLSLAQEARRLGLANRPQVAYALNLNRDFTLAQVYRDRHREAAITDADVAAFYESHPGALDDLLKNNPRLGARGGSVDERIRRQLAEFETFAERAKAEKIDKEPGVGLQIQVATSRTLRDTLVRDLQTRIQVSEEEARRYYQDHKSQYEQLRARHILFNTRPAPVPGQADTTPQEIDKEAVRRKAEEVLKRVRAGEDFSALARQYSEDPGSKERGGDLSYFGRGQMVAEFERVAFGMQPSQVSDLVESAYGFHIIKVEDRRTSPLDSGLRAEISNSVRQQQLAERLKEIKKRYAVMVEVGPGQAPADKPAQNPGGNQ